MLALCARDTITGLETGGVVSPTETLTATGWLSPARELLADV
ncbi:hypothetical protein ART_0332 [Arthrobacter sp. PAMC 25486]|nr:hypothetical protein ART_0332 [Arthrobacter sp. PAMC 25486]